jgi:para-aminobenzoate synthetase component I
MITSTEVLPWQWCTIPLAGRSGSEVFAALFRGQAIGTLLESPAAGSNTARYSICAGAPRVVAGQQRLWTPHCGQIFPDLQDLLATATVPADLPDLPFTGGWLGWLAYEAAWELEKLPAPRQNSLPFPIAYWYEPAEFAVLDHQQQILHLAVTDQSRLADLIDKLTSAPFTTAITPAPATIPQITYHTSAQEYQAAVRQVQSYIEAGDIYQANLSVRFSTQLQTPSWEIYQRLHQINPSPFASYWQTPWGEVASCSPERLVNLHHNLASTRPIAGTRPRHADPATDLRLEVELLSNDKEIAEHIMLVDLERNDLGRVCTWGSVHVDELLQVERYSHVMHLVSNVCGELAPQFNVIDLLAATFPGGTITGCPKLRCMEIIAELEPTARSLFYGSCGYLDQRGHADMNILIRTLLCHQGQVWGQVGAGIVADSDPAQEWAESLQKAQAQIQAICS